MREKLFTMRMSADEWARAEELAQHYGLNIAGLLRMLLKKEEREVFGDRATKRDRKPKSKP